MKQLLIGIGMVAATALIVLAGSAKAETSRGTGIVCKSQKGVEAIFDYGAAHAEATIPAAIEAVKAAGEDCAFEGIMYERGKNVATVKHADVVFDVSEITVVAVCEQGFCVFGKQEIAYSVFLQPKKESSLPRWIGVYIPADLSVINDTMFTSARY